MRPFSFTRTGAGLLAGVVAGYAAGVWLGYPVLVALAVGGLSILAAGALTIAVRPAVVLSRRVTPDRVHVGEPALGRIDVHNTSRWPSPAFTAVDRIGDAAVDLRVGSVGGGGRRALHYPVPTPRRGRVRLGPLTVERRDPFGLMCWRRQQTGDGVLWVRPRVHPVRQTPVGVVLDFEGRTTENARLGTVTFSTLREYVPGDDPRQIHWKSTARAGSLIVREHIDTTEPNSTVMLDTRADVLDPDAFEHAVEVAASFVDSVEKVGRPALLRILGERPGAAAAAGALSSLDRLALAERVTDRDPLRLLDTIDRIPAGGSLVVVTGDSGPALLPRLADQRRRFTPVVVVIVLAATATTTMGAASRPGMTVLTVRSGVEAATAWNRASGGGPR